MTRPRRGAFAPGAPQPAAAPQVPTGSLTLPDGEALALRDWPGDVPARAVVLVVHGLGEHSGRYAHVARQLNAWGCAVRGYDHHGHGASSGVRGALPQPDRLLDDLARVVDDTRTRYPGLPLVVLGHSMGGLVAACFVARQMRPVQALVLSSPALRLHLGAGGRLAAQVLGRLAPRLRVGNGLDAHALSHDPAVAPAYLGDPLNHDRISAALARFLAFGGEREVLPRAPEWSVPTLLLFAGQDRLVDPGGSRAFGAAAPCAQVRAQPFEPLFHEIFNEHDAGPVFAALGDWLRTQLPQQAPAAQAA